MGELHSAFCNCSELVLFSYTNQARCLYCPGFVVHKCVLNVLNLSFRPAPSLHHRGIPTRAPIRWAASAPLLPPLRHLTRSILQCNNCGWEVK